MIGPINTPVCQFFSLSAFLLYLFVIVMLKNKHMPMNSLKMKSHAL